MEDALIEIVIIVIIGLVGSWLNGAKKRAEEKEDTTPQPPVWPSEFTSPTPAQPTPTYVYEDEPEEPAFNPETEGAHAIELPAEEEPVAVRADKPRAHINRNKLRRAIIWGEVLKPKF